jgi:hypothetical protein
MKQGALVTILVKLIYSNNRNFIPGESDDCALRDPVENEMLTHISFYADSRKIYRNRRRTIL